jgi:hypothetical protein
MDRHRSYFRNLGRPIKHLVIEIPISVILMLGCDYHGETSPEVNLFLSP